MNAINDFFPQILVVRLLDFSVAQILVSSEFGDETTPGHIGVGVPASLSPNADTEKKNKMYCTAL